MSLSFLLAIVFGIFMVLGFVLAYLLGKVALMQKENIVALEAKLEAATHIAIRYKRQAVQGGIEQERVKQLLRLCHPDKHDNSKASNEVTQWLLSQREAA